METISAGQLKALKFFHRLPLELIQTLLNTGHIQNLPKKSLLFSSGEKIQNVLILLSGEVAVYNLTKHGQRKILFFLGKGHKGFSKRRFCNIIGNTWAQGENALARTPKKGWFSLWKNGGFGWRSTGWSAASLPRRARGMWCALRSLS